MQSLNPYVDVAVETDLGPFAAGGEEEIVAWLEKYKIDLVCATDMNRDQMVRGPRHCAAERCSHFAFADQGECGMQEIEQDVLRRRGIRLQWLRLR